MKCLNNGVCRPLFLNYTCECLGKSYSGRHYEIIAPRIVIRKIVMKSLGSIAIFVLVGVVCFFVIMDILKYFFRIDPTEHELEKVRRAKVVRRVQRRPVIQRFIYVNGSPSSSSHPPNKIHLNIEKATV
jgi:hypothetical protein